MRGSVGVEDLSGLCCVGLGLEVCVLEEDWGNQTKIGTTNFCQSEFPYSKLTQKLQKCLFSKLIFSVLTFQCHLFNVAI